MSAAREDYLAEVGNVSQMLEQVVESRNRNESDLALGLAQVHATLAHAAATADVADAIRALANAARPMGGRL